MTCDHNSLHFCEFIFIEPKYRSRSCDNTRTVIYISAKKKSIDYSIDYWTFTINYFLEQEWYLCPLTAVAYMSIVTFICDDYTTCLKIINCITQVMIILEPCRNNWVTNFSCFFLCACIVCVILHTQKCKLTQFPQKRNNKSDWYGSATESHNLWSCRIFRGCWSQVSDLDLTSFLLQTCNAVLLAFQYLL